LKHADPRALEFRFTVGRVLALTGRGLVACRWHIALIVVPTAIAAVGARWLASPYIEAVPAAWQEMVHMWLGVLVETVAYATVTFAALSYLQGRALGARDVLRLPWRRLPAILVAGFALQVMTWWPEALLEWPDDHRAVIDYAILAINVLVFDVLTFVWLPVQLIENASIVAAFRRSIHLGTRHPWRLLAIDIGLWAVYYLFFAVAGQVYRAIDPESVDLAWRAVVVMWIVLGLPVACCLSAAVYHLVRSEHEGPAPETLACVFD